MGFWQLFYSESLQSPWAIKPVSDAKEETMEVKTPYAFIVEKNLNEQAFEMLGKMILAIQLKNEQVSLIEVAEEDVDKIKMVGEPKKILFFGKNYPGSFGQARNWYGHQVVQSHKVSKLLDNVDLKRETWMHLKKFAGLR